MALTPRIEAPELLAGGRVQREDFFGGGVDEDGSSDHEGTGLQASFDSDIHSPGYLELFDVFAVDLGERGEVVAVGVAAVDWPVLTGRGVFLSGAVNS